MQEHLIVTLDGTDYLVEPGTNLLEFIKSRIRSYLQFAITNQWDQSRHVIHVWLKLMGKLSERVVRQLIVQ